MMKSHMLVAVLCFAYASAVSFSGNISINGNANGWQYRDTTMFATFGPLIEYLSVDVDTSANYRSFNVSAITGGGVFLPGDYPFAYIASGSEQGTGGGTNSSDFSLAIGYIATAYYSLDEKSPNGTVVASTSLRNSDFFSSSPISWQLGYVQTNTGGPLSAASVIGTPTNGASWNINITFVASSTLGVIDLAHAVVGPSSLEQIVQINNYKYQSANNHLSLVMYTASGSLNADATSTITTLTSGSGSSQVYFSASATAVVNGQTSSVSVNTAVVATTDPGVQSLSSNFIARVQSKFSSAAQFNKVTADFAAGAESIAYDPSQGAGTSLPASGSSGSSSPASSTTVASAAFSFFVLALVALLL